MPTILRCLAAISGLMVCTAGQAADQVYRYIDADGKPMYSSLPPPAGTPYERVDVSPAGGPGKGKTSGEVRRDEKDKAKHSTASGSVPYKEVWRGKAQVPVTGEKPAAASANVAACAAGQGDDCKAASPAK